MLGPRGRAKGRRRSGSRREYEIPHIATGDLYRAAIARGHRARPARRAARDRTAVKVASHDVRNVVFGRGSLRLRPLPAPCGPRRGRSSEESFVVPHHHLRFHLAHRVERDADDDEHRGAAEGGPVACENPKYLMKRLGAYRDRWRGTRARQGQTLQHAIEVGPPSAEQERYPGCTPRVSLRRLSA